ncbi:MAG: hypothetical protein COX80_04565 [Candidatus Magasanikbacteria bacterium CG_4_10_14_0_2_um_filter_33_14]|uniref:Uncharacterized protein n=1 Tax=Candidatus Magasanikbacteria bacterium CG_4_10_14_0_2_um_filter_33_14 TaxID=1974636 RepID=A0A2M7V9A0_9BACT|nr:MAG: hypothetical protein COX80_04565 [Candidatus Magasanikbacteria bacterium CG_4_10_14_0_2_um_filter_33_14]
MEENNLPSQTTNNLNPNNSSPETPPPIIAPAPSFFKKHLWKIISGILALILIFFVILYFLPYDEEYDDLGMNDINFEDELGNLDDELNNTLKENENTTNQLLENNNIVSYLDNLEYTDEEENGTDLVTYLINTDNTLQQDYLNKTAKYKQEVNNIDEHEFIWNYTSEIFSNIPEKNYIKKFIINTDGPEGNLASMHLSDTNTWEIYVDPADVLKNGKVFDSMDFIYTVVHEFGHLITLNERQVDHGIYYEDECETSLISEGCPYVTSYYNQFENLSMMTKESDFDNWLDAIDTGDEDEIYYFYEDHTDNFVTPYAATDQAEDIAESFTNFVLRDKPTSNTTLKDQKVNFFYQFSELVNMRQQLRDNVLVVDNTFFSKPLIIK